MPLLALVGAAVAVVGPGLLVGVAVPPPPASGRTRLMQTTWQRAVFFASSALVVTSTWPESDGVRGSSSVSRMSVFPAAHTLFRFFGTAAPGLLPTASLSRSPAGSWAARA